MVFFYFYFFGDMIIIDNYERSVGLKYYLAIDIGASSGRHIVGWTEGGEIRTREVFRFPNGTKTEDGHLVWDMESLIGSVIDGIREAFRVYPEIESLAIDTWGVDYVLLDGDEEIYPVYAYRDGRAEAVIPRVHERIPFEELYSRVGCQFQPFNSIYQLYDDKQKGRLARASDMLMIPEYLAYRLCGVKAREYTNATTTGMVNGGFDMEIVRRLGYPTELFGRLSQPGTVLGELLPDIQKRVNGNCRVVLCATHDTASAVEGIPMEDNSPYISSGTWSLLGVKTPKALTDAESMRANYSNEGGVGYNRYQKNIMGMWVVNELRRELCPDRSFSDIVEMAKESGCDKLVDVNASEFLAPMSMKEAFDRAAGGLCDIGDYFSCAYRSLAQSYKVAIEKLEANTGRKYDKLYIVGGGAKNDLLNKLTEAATGKKVIALPIEASAIGNIKIQMEI